MVHLADATYGVVNGKLLRRLSGASGWDHTWSLSVGDPVSVAEFHEGHDIVRAGFTVRELIADRPDCLIVNYPQSDVAEYGMVSVNDVQLDRR